MRTLLVQGLVLGAACAGGYLVYQQFFAESSGAKQEKMGCLESKPAPADDGGPAKVKKAKTSSEAPATSNTTAAPKEEPPKKKLDWRDFRFSKKKGETLIKKPGEVNGQMFVVEDCEDCDIYICDFNAQVQLDYNTNCRIFIGPSESSIFIRNCENCKCILACQQYRARECKDCDTLLFSSTAPVVETSKNMRFGCFRFAYFDLGKQFESAKLSVFNNKWSEIYDFTPADGNWSFLPLETKGSDLMKPLYEQPSFNMDEERGLSETDIVPFTVGLRKKDFEGQDRCFVLILPNKETEGLQMLTKICEAGCAIIQTKQMKLDANKAKQMMERGDSSLASSLTKGMIVGVEVAGSSAVETCQKILKEAGGGVGHASESEGGAAYEINLFFDQWKDFVGHGITK